MIDANALLDEIRQELQPVKEQLLRHHYVQALKEGKIGREKLRLFAGEQYTLITSDLRSVEKKPGRRSETYLAEGQRLSHTGSWARNVSSGEVFWSQETFRIFAFVGSRSVLLRRLCINSLVVKDKE